MHAHIFDVRMSHINSCAILGIRLFYVAKDLSFGKRYRISSVAVGDIQGLRSTDGLCSNF